MEDFLAALGIAYFWRAIVSGLAAMFVAFVAARVLPGGAMAVGVVLTIIGLFFGLLWQAKAMTGRKLTEPDPPMPPISAPIAIVGMGSLGGVLAGAGAHALHSWALAALIAIAAIAFIGLWYLHIRLIALTRNHLVLTAGFALGVVCGLVAIAWPVICGASTCVAVL